MIKDIGDGVHEIKISFDITNQDQNMSFPRNYPLEKIRAMIRSKEVQKYVKDGYAIIMYGHGARDKTQGYFANEKNATTGELQEPIGKVTSLSIKGKIITYTATLVETDGNKAASVVKLIKNKIGGFSFVMDVGAGELKGVDYVLSPNFNGNRVVMDSLCGENGCTLSTAIDDEVKSIIGDKEDLFDEAKDLLLMQDNTIEAKELKAKINEKESAFQDKIDELETEVENQKGFVDHYKEELTKANTKVGELEEELVELAVKQDDIAKKKDAEIAELQSRLDFLSESIASEGLSLKEDGTVTLDTLAFGDVVKSFSVTPDFSVDTVMLDNIALKRPQRKTNFGLWDGAFA